MLDGFVIAKLFVSFVDPLAHMRGRSWVAALDRRACHQDIGLTRLLLSLVLLGPCVSTHRVGGDRTHLSYLVSGHASHLFVATRACRLQCCVTFSMLRLVSCEFVNANEFNLS